MHVYLSRSFVKFLGDLDNDVLYGDLNFADDEQTNPDLTDEEKITKVTKKVEEYEDGEILDDELFSAASAHNVVEAKVTEPSEKDDVSTEPNDTDIENAVDDAMNKLLNTSKEKNTTSEISDNEDR